MKRFPKRHRAKQQQPKPEASPLTTPARLRTLKHKLEALNLRIAAATAAGDTLTKTALEAEATQMRATVARASALLPAQPNED